MPARRAVMRMAGDADRALPANLGEDRVGRLVGADVLLDVERDDVRVALAAKLVLRDLGPGHHQHVVFAAGPLGLVVDLGEVVVERVLTHTERAAPERARSRPALASKSRFIRM